MIVSAAIAP